MKKTFLTLCAGLCVANASQALQTPTKSMHDSRITKAVYNEDDVFPIYAVPGRAVLVSFASGETVESVVSGFSTAWDIEHVGNHLFLKSKDTDASTNLVVVTDRRTYHFELRLGWKPSKATYELRFSYPEDEKRAALLKQEAEKKKALLKQSPRPKEELLLSNLVNRNYTINFGGARDARKIAPVAAFDDGRFTFLKFPLKSDFPAVYQITGGEESLVNHHVEGNWLVLHGIFSELRLRNGQQVAGVYNEDFHTQAVQDTPTNVTVNGLQRELNEH